MACAPVALTAAPRNAVRYGNGMTARIISETEFRRRSGAILKAVAGGETLRITRDGVEIAELRPVSASHSVPMATVLGAMRNVPAVSLRELRAEEDALFPPDESAV